MDEILKKISILLFSFVLLACGGGSSSEAPTSNTAQPKTKTVSGILAVPQTNATQSLNNISLLNKSLDDESVTCPLIPTGYSPMVGADLEFLGDNNILIVTVENASDNCGFFSASIPVDVVQIRAKLGGYQDLLSDITHFSNQSNTVASTISTTAEYKIVQLNTIGEKKISFVIADTVSNNPVLGLPALMFDINMDGKAANLLNFQATVAAQDNASMVLTLDASAFMSVAAYTEPTTNKIYNRFQITNLAAQQFLNEQKSDDELAMLVFDNEVSFFDNAQVNSLFSDASLAGTPANISYPENGFIRNDKSMLHFAVDAYNPYSIYWGNDDVLHNNSPASYVLGTFSYDGLEKDANSNFPWFAKNAVLYDALYESVTQVCKQSKSIKFVVVISGAADTNSIKSEIDVINKAKSCNTPIYTVGFGADVDANLDNIATATGASFYAAADIDLIENLHDIQNNVLFQYTSDINSSFSCEYTFTLSARINEQNVERTIKGDATVCPPTASIDTPADDASFNTSDVITFTSSAADNTSVTSFAWVFGDGTISDSQNPMHQYRSAGNYTVTLTVTDNDDLSVTESISLMVKAGNEPSVPVGRGGLNGSVFDAVSNAVLAGVKVEVYRENTLIDTTTTGSEGAYRFAALAVAADYQLKFSVAGYQAAVMQNIAVVVGISSFVEPLLQINNSASGSGHVSGQITDTFTGVGLSAVSIKLRPGIGVSSGDIIAERTTDEGGAYNIDNLGAGYYTAEVSQPEYSTALFTIIVIGGGDTRDNQNISLTPLLNLNETRVVLTRGQTENDLDLHLTGPKFNGADRFHVFFSNKTYSDSENDARFYLENAPSFASEIETITLQKTTAGIYRYFVHDYTNRDETNSLALSQSSAVVKVYQGIVLVGSYKVPTQAGTLWTVFELENGIVKPINTMSHESSILNIK